MKIQFGNATRGIITKDDISIAEFQLSFYESITQWEVEVVTRCLIPSIRSLTMVVNAGRGFMSGFDGYVQLSLPADGREKPILLQMERPLKGSLEENIVKGKLPDGSVEVVAEARGIIKLLSAHYGDARNAPKYG